MLLAEALRAMPLLLQSYAGCVAALLPADAPLHMSLPQLPVRLFFSPMPANLLLLLPFGTVPPVVLFIAVPPAFPPMPTNLLLLLLPLSLVLAAGAALVALLCFPAVLRAPGWLISLC
jgi:hypothetical protein